MKSFLFFTLFLIHGTVFCQIYCPSGEVFQGPVKKVKIEFYSRERKILSDREDTPIALTSSSSILFEHGKLIQKTIQYPSGNLKCYCTNEYDSSGNLHERIIYTPDSLIDVRKVYFYTNRKWVKTEYYNRKNELFSTRIYDIDSSQFIAKSMEVFDDSFEDLIYYSLNSDFSPIESYKFDESGNKVLYQTTEYDSLKRVIKQVNYKEKMVEGYSTYTYDEANRIIESSMYDANNRLVEKDSVSYDQYSNIVYSKKYSSTNLGKIDSFTYQYDSYGNYIYKMSWKGVGSFRYLISRESRVITYE